MTEQRPSKELMSTLRHWNHPVAQSALKALERMQTALRGIQSCSTCEACRGAAARALGRAAPEPDHVCGPWSQCDSACVERASREPRVCECIPLAPRPYNFCQDCGGRITPPPGDEGR